MGRVRKLLLVALNCIRWLTLPLAALCVFDLIRLSFPAFGRFIYWQLPGQALLAAALPESWATWFSGRYNDWNIVLSGGIGGYAAVAVTCFWVPSRKRLAAGIVGALLGMKVMESLVGNGIRHEWLAFAEMIAAIVGTGAGTARALFFKEAREVGGMNLGH